MSSPYKLARDSPSRQLLWELNQLAISSQKRFYAHLDRENEERENLHKEALAAASAEHERVRRSAELFRERLEEQIQAERRRRDEEARKEVEKLRKEAERQAAEQRREEERLRAARIEEEKAAEKARQEREIAEKQRAERARQTAEQVKNQKKHDQEHHAKERDESAGIASTEARVARKESLQQQPNNSALLPGVSSPAVSLNPTITQDRKHVWETEHKRYVEIHSRLKELRKYMAVQAKKNEGLKKIMGDKRREIRKSVGQLREGRGANKQQLANLIKVLKEAAQFSGPAVDITLFLASPPAQGNDSQGPGLLVYLLNIFAKAIVAQFIDEAGVKPQIADAVGTVASHIFALDAFRWKGLTLIDILVSKLHIVCPVLFGINGDEKTPQGKQRLGWWREEKGGTFIPEQRHFERMTGLGAGFAAISLRNYEKANARNPFPDNHYWTAFSRVANVPPHEISQTHMVVLKAMIDGNEGRFLQFYGDAALAALRLALVELPRKSPPSVASKSLAGLVDILKKEKNLAL